MSEEYQTKLPLLEDRKLYHSITKILSATMPESSKLQLQQWCERIGEKEADRIMRESLKRGREIDQNVQLYFETGNCENDLLKNFLSGYKIRCIEQDVFSDIHKYKGRYDCIFEKDGRVIINDFKGSGKPKKKDWLNDYPLQLASYRAALLENGIHIDYGMISMLVEETREVQVFIFSAPELNSLFKQFQIRLQQYLQLLSKTK
ncbi:MAG TPA: PD-(D/E)XK nuclease family protein [Bacteroidia bacterium]|nr:PD-(D/E)XK nuclease family protein [Bacteroidia bacterium]